MCADRLRRERGLINPSRVNALVVKNLTGKAVLSVSVGAPVWRVFGVSCARHGCQQQQFHPRAPAVRLPAAGRGPLPHVLAARGPEGVSRGGGSGERHPGQVRAERQEHPEPLRGRLLPPAHRAHLRGAGQRQRQVRVFASAATGASLTGLCRDTLQI